ncbi:MAG: hypothetical protein AABY00_00555 [Nanoarchaeota archaeon]
MPLTRIGPGSWKDCLEQIVRNNRKVVSSREITQELLNQGVGKNIYDKPIWLAECTYAVGNQIFLARDKLNVFYDPKIKDLLQKSHIVLNSLDHNSVKINNLYFGKVIENIAGQDMKKPIEERRVLHAFNIDLSSPTTYTLSTDSFADDPIMVWYAGGSKVAKRLGLYLKTEVPDKFRTDSFRVELPPAIVCVLNNFMGISWIDLGTRTIDCEGRKEGYTLMNLKKG